MNQISFNGILPQYYIISITSVTEPGRTTILKHVIQRRKTTTEDLQKYLVTLGFTNEEIEMEIFSLIDWTENKIRDIMYADESFENDLKIFEE